jgi:hypothetical protein
MTMVRQDENFLQWLATVEKEITASKRRIVSLRYWRVSFDKGRTPYEAARHYFPTTEK